MTLLSASTLACIGAIDVPFLTKLSVFITPTYVKCLVDAADSIQLTQIHCEDLDCEECKNFGRKAAELQLQLLNHREIAKATILPRLQVDLDVTIIRLNEHRLMEHWAGQMFVQ